MGYKIFEAVVKICGKWNVQIAGHFCEDASRIKKNGVESEEGRRDVFELRERYEPVRRKQHGSMRYGESVPRLQRAGHAQRIADRANRFYLVVQVFENLQPERQQDAQTGVLEN
jgi:hypothetical protein